MRPHTQRFKEEIAKLGRQIKTEVWIDINTSIRIENSTDFIGTEDGNTLTTERDQTPGSQALQPGLFVSEEEIYSVDIIKNGSLLKTLMKQCNIELKHELSIGSVFSVKLGVLVDDDYEFLDYGKFIVYSKEYNVENDTWQHICYDQMLWAMKKYIRLNINYPITVKDYINAIANKIGINTLSASEQFTNYDKLIYKDYFAGKNVTYRDILDKLAEITASSISATEYGFIIRYPQETNDVLDENYLKNINVNFGKQFGPINKIEAIDKENNLYYLTKDNTSIQENGETKITITNNPFIFNGQENEICENILNKLKEISYSINDFTTTGVCYYDYLDLFTVSAKGQNYKCLLLNNEIKIQQGIEETIFSEALENTATETNNYQSTGTQKQTTLSDDNKVNKNNIVNTINQNIERGIIRTDKIFLITAITDATDADGFLNTNLNSGYVICSAVATFSDNNYGFIIPYYDYNNGSPIWKLKIEDKNKVALANTQISVTIYYFRSERSS